MILNFPAEKSPPEQKGRFFSAFQPMIQAAGGLSLGQVCSITGLEPSTVQNWIKRGYVARPVRKKYYERQLARILLISMLRESMRIEQIGEVMKLVNGSTEDSSDDLIPETVLYDYLIKVLDSQGTGPFDPPSVAKSVKLALKDNEPASSDDRIRLEGALQVMTYAAISSQFKQKAEENLSKLISASKSKF